MNAQMTLESGQIIGMVMRHSVEEWDQFLSEATAAAMDEKQQFRYAEHVALLTELRHSLESNN